MLESKYPTSANQEPMLIVISGPSGVGKDSVIQLMKLQGLPFYFVVTATSRLPRSNEIPGADYIFVTREKFEEMIHNGELLEYARVYEDFKGVPTTQVREALASGKDVVMRVDVQGAATIRQLFPDALLIFLVASTEELIIRIKQRREDSPEEAKKRMDVLPEELKHIDEFDFVVVNRDGALLETANTIQSIILSEHHRSQPRKVAL